MQESEVLSYPKGKEEAETSKICCVVICRRAFVTPTRQIQKVIFTASMPSSFGIHMPWVRLMSPKVVIFGSLLVSAVPEAVVY